VRVIINTGSLLGQKTGVGNYLSHLLSHLRPHLRDQLDEFPQGLLRGVWSAALRMRGLLRRKPVRQPATGPSPGRSSWKSRTVDLVRGAKHRVLARLFRSTSARKKYDIYHEPNFLPFAVDIPTIVTIHDLSVLTHPEWHPADRVASYERRFREGIDSCAHIVAVSESARQDVIDLLGFPPERVTRTYLGMRRDLHPLPAEETRARLAPLGLKPDYLLYVGTLEPRKNVLMLLRAYCALPAALRERCPLVLVGGWGWNTGELAEYLHAEGRHRGVIHLGYLPDDSLIALYNGARALVFPSFCEGFGLPPLEMMACGGAVLASTATALVETTGGRARLTDPEDEAGWHQAMKRIIEEDDWRDSLREGTVEWARGFSWERCARETLDVYRAVAEGKPALVRKVG
jgi:alpha-1,3-rhamnosyl/mannosyltransferase